jgi:hypothetical protein
MQRSQISDQVKSALLEISRALGIRHERVLDLYSYVSPETVRILDIVERGGEIVGVRLSVRSASSRGTWYYVAVGIYGAKCTCKWSVVRNRICKHVVIGLITWCVVSLLKLGRRVDLSRIGWLREPGAGSQSF